MKYVKEINYKYTNFVRSIVFVILVTKLRWAGHVAGMGETKEVYMVLVGNPEGKRPLGRPRRR